MPISSSSTARRRWPNASPIASSTRPGSRSVHAGRFTSRSPAARRRREPTSSWRAIRVPPSDDASNYKMAKLAMFDPLKIDATHIFRMPGEADPQRAAAEYAEVLRTQLGERPRFDLIMLGMGPDGHTASLFPGSAPPADAPELVVAPFVPKLKAHRITLTPRVINAAKAVIIAAAGPTKTDVLERVLRGPYDPITYPVQLVAPVDGTLTWYVDRTAAAKLALF